MTRVILHSDLNNFYASCELIRRPELKDKRLVVCGSVKDRHGVVLAKNYNAKAYGITTGMPLIRAYELCPDLVAVEADFHYYLHYSRLVRKIYDDYTDKVEPFGIDEAWLDVTNSKFLGSGEEIADEIRSRVKTLGLTASVGVSFNKIFAKLGSDLKKPDATTVITTDNYKDIVWPLPASELLFVGRKTAQKLKKYNINTIGDIARSDRNFLVREFGKVGEYFYDHALGKDDDPVKRPDESDDIKSIGNSMTCYRDLVTIDDVKVLLLVLCDSVSARLIADDVGAATVVTVTVRDEFLKSFTRQSKLPKPSVLSDDFFKCALKLFTDNYSFSAGVRSLGVSVGGFVKDGGGQISMFDDDADYDKRVKLAGAVGKIRNKYGNVSVMKARNLTDKRIKMNDDSLSSLSAPPKDTGDEDL